MGVLHSQAEPLPAYLRHPPPFPGFQQEGFTLVLGPGPWVPFPPQAPVFGFLTCSPQRQMNHFRTPSPPLLPSGLSMLLGEKSQATGHCPAAGQEGRLPPTPMVCAQATFPPFLSPTWKRRPHTHTPSPPLEMWHLELSGTLCPLPRPCPARLGGGGRWGWKRG